MRDLPPQSVVKDWLSYDPETGILVWRKEPRRSRPVIGTQAGTTTPLGYIMVCLQGQLIQAHRLAWLYVHGELSADVEIDHIDGNPTNNAISNLRLATSAQQKQNKRVQSNNVSGLKGAMYHAAHKGKKWRSQIKSGGRLIFLGYFHTAQEAHEAYGKAAREHFGEFARLA